MACISKVLMGMRTTRFVVAMAISRLDSHAPAVTTRPSSSRPSATSKAYKDVEAPYEASDGEKTHNQGNERGQAGSPFAKELYEIVEKYGKAESSQDPYDLAQKLFSRMEDEYERIEKDGTNLDNIMDLLLDQENDKENDQENPAPAQYMDFCIRWSILVMALESRKSSSVAARAIAKWIVERWPKLAFVNLSDENTGEKAEGAVKDYRAQCRIKHKINEDSCTPFHRAVKLGCHDIVKAMLAGMEGIYSKATTAPESQGTLLDLVLAVDPESTKDENAFDLALTARKTSLETLKQLLLVTKSKTPPEKCSFEEAVKLGLDRAVEAYLDHGLSLDAETFCKYMELAFEKLGGHGEKMKNFTKGLSVRSASRARTCRENVVKSLVANATTTDKFTERVAQEIIKRDLLNVWDVKDGNVPAKEITERLLHMAILYGRYAFVERFVENYPKSLNALKKVPNTSTDEKRYPLWYNNHWWDDKTSKFILLPDLTDKESNSPRGKIRDVIVTKMIHLLSMNQLSDILHKSDEPFNDLCFDMSRFNAPTFQVSDFIGSLIHQDKTEQRQMLKYEHTLKYVEFPPLDMVAERREAFKESTSLRVDHDEVFQILDWLANKGVTKIIKLVVPDRLVNSHDELKMARYVHKFQVEVLDWKVLDMFVSAFRDPSSAPTTTTTDQRLGKKSTGQLRELTLYSSGKRAAIYHWFNKDDDEIETCTAKHANKLVKEIRQLQDQLSDPKSVIAYEPAKKTWYPCPSPANLSKIAQRLSPRLGAWLGMLTKYVSGRQQNSTLDEMHRPTRVAILDNGVLSISPAPSGSSANPAKDADVSAADTDVASPELGGVDAKTSLGDAAVAIQTHTPQKQPSERLQDAMGGGSNNAHDDHDKGLWSRIKAGRSFVDSSSKFCPWQFPSDPHGTQMANLICALDPTCEIYVARVAEDAFGIKPDNVTKVSKSKCLCPFKDFCAELHPSLSLQAIEWALREEVDIISMSFAMSDSDDAMEKMVRAASNRGIVMTCSTHDEGSRVNQAWPAACRNFDHSDESIIVLAACDKYGKLLREADTKKLDFKILGEHVPAGVVPFVRSEENITGSSVATALAAGLSSLILTCDRLAHPGKEYINAKMGKTGDGKHAEDQYRLGVVKKHFKKMETKDGKKFIELGNFDGRMSGSRIGQEPVAQAGGKLTNIPSVEEVLINEFGMMEPQRHSTFKTR
ncbi:hypothetical protein MY1884_001991 [Beauveria asiatica]